MRAPLTTLFLLAAFALRAIGRPTARSIAHPPISGYVDSTDSAALDGVLSVPYTHVIVGGGNTGLALAARLSEHAHNSVLVIEAGTHQPKNANISIPTLAHSSWKTEVDWDFSTVPQRNANNRSLEIPRAKVLGGSTAMSFLPWTRGFAAEYTAWATLAGSKAWTFNNLLPFFKQSETFTAPGPANVNINRNYTPSVHGHTGPVHTSFSPYVSPQFNGFVSALRKMGVRMGADASSGDNLGVSWTAQSVDPKTQKRVTSDTAYIAPIAATRSNLVILTSAQATRILWANSTSNSSLVSASGIEIVTGSGTRTAHSSGEVLICAGPYKTPQLLELSGVGDPSILTPLGIDVVVDLPGVGANFQDHPVIDVVYELKKDFESLESLTGPRRAEAFEEYANGAGMLTQWISTDAYVSPSDLLDLTEQRTALALLSERSAALPAAQQDAITRFFTLGAPMLDLVPLNSFAGVTQSPEANKSYVSIATCLQHPLSRGTVHITSKDPLAKPAIDPAYLQHPLDAFILNKGAQLVRKVAQAAEFQHFIVKEVEPGAGVQSDDEFAEWVKAAVRTQHHPIGTASMLPREEEGVVDSELFVYGTANVRVVDLSVVPLHLSTHPQSVAYAIAEKAATIINRA